MIYVLIHDIGQKRKASRYDMCVGITFLFFPAWSTPHGGYVLMEIQDTNILEESVDFSVLVSKTRLFGTTNNALQVTL